MFRVHTEWGAVVDAILSLRAEKPLSDPEYFKLVSSSNNAAQLENREKGNSLLVSTDEISFTHSRYDSELDLDVFFSHFEAVYSTVNQLLKVKNVRRIGIVAEHRIEEIEQPSRHLVARITKLPIPGFAAKFVLQYEKRTPTIEGLAPDVRSADFKNVICSFYDAEMDTSIPDEGAINANVDVQKYYAPPLASDVISAVRRCRKEFDRERATFVEMLRTLQLGAK